MRLHLLAASLVCTALAQYGQPAPTQSYRVETNQPPTITIYVTEPPNNPLYGLNAVYQSETAVPQPPSESIETNVYGPAPAPAYNPPAPVATPAYPQPAPAPAYPQPAPPAPAYPAPAQPAYPQPAPVAPAYPAPAESSYGAPPAPVQDSYGAAPAYSPPATGGYGCKTNCIPLEQPDPCGKVDPTIWCRKKDQTLLHANMYFRMSEGITCKDCLTKCAQDAASTVSPYKCISLTFDHRYGICDLYAVPASNSDCIPPAPVLSSYGAPPAPPQQSYGQPPAPAYPAPAPAYGGGKHRNKRHDQGYSGGDSGGAPAQQPQPPGNSGEYGGGAQVGTYHQPKEFTLAPYPGRDYFELIGDPKDYLGGGACPIDGEVPVYFQLDGITFTAGTAGNTVSPASGRDACLSACNKGEGLSGGLRCKSVNYNAGADSCHIFGSGISATSYEAYEGEVSQGGDAHLEKVCLPAELAGRVSAGIGEVVPGNILAGFADQELQTMSLSMCIRECLQRPTCNAGNYFTDVEAERANCILTSATKETNPVSFGPAANAFYFDLAAPEAAAGALGAIGETKDSISFRAKDSVAVPSDECHKDKFGIVPCPAGVRRSSDGEMVPCDNAIGC